MTLKEIKNTKAVDITTKKFDDVETLRKAEHGFSTIETSHGTYGINGALLQGCETGTLYKVTCRNSILFQVC